MPRESNVPLKRTTINLREGDLDFIRLHFPRHPPQKIVRSLVSRFVDSIQQRFDASEINVNIDGLKD